MHIPTVLVEAKDHPNGAVLINAADFVEGEHVLYVAPETEGETGEAGEVQGEVQKQEKPKKK